MVTNLREGMKEKCEQYWPERGNSLQQGPFKVSIVEQHIFSYYTIRTLQLSVSHTKYKMFVFFELFLFECSTQQVQ